MWTIHHRKVHRVQEGQNTAEHASPVSSPESIWAYLENVAKEKNYSEAQLSHAKSCIENIYDLA